MNGKLSDDSVERVNEVSEMIFQSPETLRWEHSDLHSRLSKLTIDGGKVREAARAVEDVLHPHFDV